MINKKLIKFLTVGGVSTLLDYIIYLLLTSYIHITIAKTISMICAIILSFILNKVWTFEYEKNTDIKLIGKYVFSQLINIMVNVSANYIIYIITNNKHVAFIFATAVATIVNYMLQKNIVFNRWR